MLAVRTQLVLPHLALSRHRNAPRPVPAPVALWDEQDMTVDAIRERCAWLAEALALRGRDAALDPAAREAMQRAYAALDYALAVHRRQKASPEEAPHE
jgi:hypothetical protein